MEAEEPLSAKRWVRVGLEKQRQCAQLQSHQRKTEALFLFSKIPFFPPPFVKKSESRQTAEGQNRRPLLQHIMPLG